MAVAEYFIRFLQRRDQLSKRHGPLAGDPHRNSRLRPGEVIVPRGQLATRVAMCAACRRASTC